MFPLCLYGIYSVQGIVGMICPEPDVCDYLLYSVTDQDAKT
jgi:hypothetical protein